MTISSHHGVMVRQAHHGVVKKVMIAELKAKLSANLRRVQMGEEIIVMDRQRPIAKLVPILEKRKPKLVIIKATRPLSDVDKIPFVRPKVDFDVVEILRETRKDRLPV